MKSSTPQGSTGGLGPEPHAWEPAAERMIVTPLADPLRRWLRDSGLPGAERMADDGSWQRDDRVLFLRLICGVQE
jgi:hypothetical protein